MHGFTCGIGDLLLTDAANAQRTRNIARGEGLGLKAACQFAERDPSGTRSMVRKDCPSWRLLLRECGGQPLAGERAKGCLLLGERARRHSPHSPACCV